MISLIAAALLECNRCEDLEGSLVCRYDQVIVPVDDLEGTCLRCACDDWSAAPTAANVCGSSGGRAGLDGEIIAQDKRRLVQQILAV